MDDVPGRLNLSLDVEGGSLDEQATDGDRWHHQAALWPSGRSGRGQTGITRRHSCAPDLSTTCSALPHMDGLLLRLTLLYYPGVPVFVNKVFIWIAIQQNLKDIKQSS